MFSRREAIANVAAAVAVSGCAAHEDSRSPDGKEHGATVRIGTLTDAQLRILVAITGRLIPSDGSGPGAIEAHAAHYIDRALGGALEAHRHEYASGLEAVDSYARRTHGMAFVVLSAAMQDEVLRAIERGIPLAESRDTAAFFALLLDHTLQGTFCDPYYGGNTAYVGWDMIGYPGLRMMVTAAEQRMRVRLPPVRGSAYDSDGYHRPSGTHHVVPPFSG